MELLAGTSGFSYDEWKGSFYPSDLTKKEMLGYYAERLPSVEINNTFYRMPRSSVVDDWVSQVGDGFKFVVKASRRITHFKLLHDVGEEVEYLLSKTARFGDSLGAILFQLPPQLTVDVERLATCVALIPDGVRAAFEFRHDSWLEEGRVVDVLADYNVALVGGDEEDGTARLVKTGDWGYLRFRRDDYSAAEIRARAAAVLSQGWSDAFVFFKHEEDGAGPPLARSFLDAAATKPTRKQAPSKKAARIKKTG